MQHLEHGGIVRQRRALRCTSPHFPALLLDYSKSHAFHLDFCISPAFHLHIPSCPITSSSWHLHFLSMFPSCPCPFLLFLLRFPPLHFPTSPFVSGHFPFTVFHVFVSPAFPLHVLLLSPSFPLRVLSISLSFPCPLPFYVCFISYSCPLLSNHFHTCPFISCSFPLHVAFIFPSCRFHFPLMSRHFCILSCISLHFLSLPLISRHFPQMSVTSPSVPSFPCHAPFHFPALPRISRTCPLHLPFASSSFPFISSSFPVCYPFTSQKMPKTFVFFRLKEATHMSAPAKNIEKHVSVQRFR